MCPLHAPPLLCLTLRASSHPLPGRIASSELCSVPASCASSRSCPPHRFIRLVRSACIAQLYLLSPLLHAASNRISFSCRSPRRKLRAERPSALHAVAASDLRERCLRVPARTDHDETRGRRQSAASAHVGVCLRAASRPSLAQQAQGRRQCRVTLGPPGRTHAAPYSARPARACVADSS
jgi:hypothetical protein